MELAYDEVGSGPPVLFVSGWSQPGRRWKRVADVLADRYHALMPDNRECGRTGPSPEPFTLADLADDLVALMDRLGHDRFFLVGTSMGGMIAQEVLRRATDRVAAAVLVSTHGGTPTSVLPPDPMVVMPVGTTRYEIGRNLWARLAAPGFAEAHPEIMHEEALVAAEHEVTLDGIMRQLDAIRAWDPGDALVEVARRVPVTVVHGIPDPLVPYENGVRLAERLGVPLVTFENCGHGITFERTAELADVIGAAFEPYRSSSSTWPSPANASAAGPSTEASAASASSA